MNQGPDNELYSDHNIGFQESEGKKDIDKYSWKYPGFLTISFNIKISNSFSKKE